MRILVGVDLGRSGYERTVAQAGRFAVAVGGAVDLLYVGSDSELPRLEAVLATLPEAARGRAYVRDGSPVDALLEESASADVLVVGPRAPNPLERLLLGTVAARVIRRARTAVLVPRKEFPDRSDPTVLCGVDLGRPPPYRVFDAAASWAARLGGRLDVLYVDDFRPPALKDAKLREAAEREIEAVRAPIRARLEALLDTLPEAHRGQPVMVGGDAGSRLAETSERYDLVVIGALERQGIAQHLLGSVAEYVVSHADACVLAVPAVDQPSAK